MVWTTGSQAQSWSDRPAGERPLPHAPHPEVVRAGRLAHAPPQAPGDEVGRKMAQARRHGHASSPRMHEPVPIGLDVRLAPASWQPGAQLSSVRAHEGMPCFLLHGAKHARGIAERISVAISIRTRHAGVHTTPVVVRESLRALASTMATRATDSCSPRKTREGERKRHPSAGTASVSLPCTSADTPPPARPPPPRPPGAPIATPRSPPPAPPPAPPRMPPRTHSGALSPRAPA